eukprot:SAG31_NODE_15201_length_766_cov_0.713643_1_plen_65_part_01
MVAPLKSFGGASFLAEHHALIALIALIVCDIVLAPLESRALRLQSAVASFLRLSLEYLPPARVQR